MRRIILLLAVMAIMAAMTTVPAFAQCPVCPVAANDQAQGSFFTGSTAVLAEPTNQNSLNAERGLSTAFMRNTNP